MNRRALSVVFCVVLATGAEAGTTRSATSCNRDDVLTAVDSAVAGDTIVIPAGRCTWSSSLALDKPVTLQGAGIDQTVLVDGLTKGTWPHVPQLLTWTLQPTGMHRLTQLTIDGGTGERDSYNQGIVKILGSSVPNFRLDHVKFITRRTAGVMFYDVLGVIDHCVFELTNYTWAMYVFHPSWNGVGRFGDNSWAQPSNLGTAGFLFVEDSTFTNMNASSLYAVDGWSGARVVYRHNRFNNTVLANHGTESGGRLRGMRAFEVYENDFVFDDARVMTPTVQGNRGGVGVVWNNRLTVSGGSFVSRFADLTYYRSEKAFAPWGKCDGTSVWDENVSGETGWRCLDQPGVGQGALLSGDTPAPAEWPRQVPDPSYYWNNTKNGELSLPAVNGPTIRLNRDYFLSPRPSYTPYVYPHPLVELGDVMPPTNLRIVP